MVGTCPHATCDGKFPSRIVAVAVLLGALACVAFLAAAALLPPLL
jgi:hypothetical protein